MPGISGGLTEPCDPVPCSTCGRPDPGTGVIAPCKPCCFQMGMVPPPAPRYSEKSLGTYGMGMPGIGGGLTTPCDPVQCQSCGRPDPVTGVISPCQPCCFQMGMVPPPAPAAAATKRKVP